MTRTHRDDVVITESDTSDSSTLCRTVADLDDRSFFAAWDNAAPANQVWVVDFWAPWCGPCAELHPRFDAHAAERSGGALRFGRVNVDESPGVASAFDVMSIPTLIVIDADGHEIEREVGVPSKRQLGRLVRRAASIADEHSGHGAR